jgi:UDP-3-O-[3-hydroxymyristoyl] glucosamine N-acyltransferase
VLVAASKIPLARDVGSAVLCGADLAASVPPGRRWIHEHVWWVVAQLLGNEARTAEEAQTAASSVSPRAVVHPTAIIDAGAVVRADAHIGADTVVGCNAVIYGKVRIGARAEIGAGSVIGAPGFGWALDPDGRAFRVPQRGGVVIEDDVSLGALCTVDAGTLGPTILRRGVRLDAQVHVGHNAEIGQETWVAAQCGFGGSTCLGARVRVGGQAGVRDHVTVGDGVTISAKTGVIGDIAAGASVAGFPAVDRRRWLRAMAELLRRR